MRRILAIVPLVLLAHCVAPSAPPPPVAPTPEPAPAPAPLPPPPPAVAWADRPVTAGDWTYRQEQRGSIAAFGNQFTIRCEAASGQVSLERAGAPGAAPSMTIRTTSATRALPLRGGVASLPARDPLLDAIGFSRGRFAVEVAGSPALNLPTWSEVQRVVEDCRR